MSFRSGRRDLDSFPIPRWFAAVCAMGLALALDASIALADPGSVELRNGGRVRGEIVAVLPFDRVVVLVEGAGSMTIAWSDVDTVIDGERIYHAGGDVSTRSGSRTTEASVASTATAPSATATSATPPSVTATSATPPSATAPSATALSATAPSANAPFDARARMPGSFAPLSPAETRESLVVYSSLPGRAGAVTLTSFGSLVLAQGLILTALAASFSTSCFDCGDASSFGRAFLIPGTLSMGLGALMVGLGIRKLRIRSRALESLHARGFFVADLGGSRTLGLDADVAADRIVPRLQVRF